MRYLLALFFLSFELFAYEFGLKINEFNTAEVDSYFNYEYGKARPYKCNLRSLFLPQNDRAKVFKLMFKDAYKSLRSLACNIDNKNYFLWLIFDNDILKQIKYELKIDYEKIKKELENKYPKIIENKANIDDFYMSDYLEFEIGIKSTCDSDYCKDFSIFKLNDELEILIIRADLNGINKTCLVIRSLDLVQKYNKYKENK